MTNPLIVPVEVNTYLVNKRTASDEKTYGLWQLDFTTPENLGTPPEPYPNLNQPNPPKVGAWVDWSLPSAQRTAQEADLENFPLVPNRWLVVRSSRSGAGGSDPSFKAWVVESDHLVDADDPNFNDPDFDKYPWTDSNYSPYPFTVTTGYTIGDSDFKPGDLKQGFIGRPFDVAGWAEHKTDALSLTALGPGHLAFSRFQPYHRGVFSFYDDLRDGVADPSTLDYMVMGWYSDPTQDILAHASDLGALLDQLGWSHGRSTTDAVSVYAGTSLRLPWTTQQPLASGLDNRPDNARDVKLAIGHDTSEAGTAEMSGNHVVENRLFHAFLADQMNTLDQDPNEFNDAVHSTWFMPQGHDYAWTIIDAPGDCKPNTTDAELEKERTWLAALNTKQYQYNQLVHNKAGLQDRLYTAWRLNVMPPQGAGTEYGKPPSFRATDEINKLIQSLKNVKDQLASLTTGEDAIPYGADEEAFQASIVKYEKAQGLDPNCENESGVHRVLKQLPLPRFYTPNDPVALIDGVNADKVAEYPDVLPCRSLDQLTAQITIDNNLQPPPPAPAVPDWHGQLPSELQGAFAGLFLEFTLLSRAAATDANDLLTDLGTIQDGVSPNFKDASGNNTAPGYFTSLWHQPWEPSYVLWRVDYYPVPVNASDGYHWVFDASSGRYQLAKQGSPAPINKVQLLGRSALTDLPYQLTKNAVERQIRTYGDAPAEALRELPQVMRGAISQMMDGYIQNLEQRMGGAGVKPNPNDDGDISDLLADYDYPDSGFPLPDPEGMIDASLTFTPAAAGQFYFSFVAVVDSMGRNLVYINSAAGDSTLHPNERGPSIADTLKPTLDNNQPILVMDTNPNDGGWGPGPIYVQVAPRIAEPTRLRFDFVSANTSPQHPGAVINDPPVVATPTTPAPSPVIGWLLVNQLTGSLLIHDADGVGIVEGRKGIGTQDSSEVPAIDWTSLPYYPYDDDPTDQSGDFAQACPELYGFLTGLTGAGVAGFDSLVAAIGDSALTPPPTSNTSTMVAPLVGTPVALLRARLALQSATLPITDPSWDHAVEFPTPDYLKNAWKWNIRLGRHDTNSENLIDTTDGLIGYFTHKTDTNGHVQTDKPTDYTVLRTADGHDTGYAQKITAQDLALPVNLADMPEDPNKDPQAPAPVTAYVTMVVHPWAEIHAVSDILPTATLRLPDEDVRTPLSRLRIPCHMGPILAATRPLPTGKDGDNDQVTAVVMPRPDNWTGTWNWSQIHPVDPRSKNNKQAALDWEHYPLTPPDTLAHFDQGNPQARTGYLTLAAALGDAPPPTEQNQRIHDDAPTTDTRPEPES